MNHLRLLNGRDPSNRRRDPIRGEAAIAKQVSPLLGGEGAANGGDYMVVHGIVTEIPKRLHDEGAG